ncbi:MAG TPA: gliding motility-associated C-terminal domain-containing protein [Saprospiraceae bacterium]|nr:gliding motility-associated C-terminal domain-containing protein [Saprospiraceae bacterium]
MRDAQGCIDCDEIFIDNDNAPRFDSAVVTQATCTQNIGTITVYAWSFFPLEYSLNGVFWQSSNVFNGLGPGVYTIYIRDIPFGCITTTQVIIEPLSMPTIDEIIVTHAECDNPGSLTVVSSGGNGNHLYSLDNVNFQSSPVFPGLSAGNYTVYIKDEKDCSDNAPAIILATSTDTTSLTVTICEGESVIVGNEEFDSTGMYAILLINQDGCDSTVTLDLTVEVCCEPPVTLFDVSICAGQIYVLNGIGYSTAGIHTDTLPDAATNGCDSILVLDLEILFPTDSLILAAICAGEVFTWSGGSHTQAGTYIDTLIGANGCDSIATLVLSLIDAPLADAGIDQTLSCASFLVTLSGVGTGTPQWAGPGITVPDNWQQDVSQPGTYILSVTSLEGCVSYDTVQVLLDTDTPVADAGPDQFITCVTDSVMLNGSSNDPEFFFTWTGPGITTNLIHEPTPVVYQPGVYILIVTDTVQNCVSPPDTVLVTDIRVDVIAQIDASGNLDCDQISVQLSASGSTTGSGIVYLWMNAAGQIAINVSSIHATEAGLYLLYAIDTLSGCQAVDSHLVMDFTEFPPATAGENQILDCTDELVTLEANSNQQLPGLLYSWSGPPGGIVSNPDYRIIYVGLPGDYIVQVLDTLTGCMSTDTVTVFDARLLPNADAGPPQVIECHDDVALLDGSQSSSGPEYLYVWNGPGVSNVEAVSIEVEIAGIYELSVMNMQTGCADSDSTEVQMAEFLSGADISVINPTCFGDTSGQILVETPIGGTPPYLYSLDGILFQISPVFNGLVAGTYSVIVRDSFNCEWETIVTLNEGPGLSLDIGPDLELVFGDSAQLFAVIVPPGIIDSITWSPADVLSCTHCLNPWFIPLSANSIVISATVYAGNCSTIDYLVVHVEEDFTLFVPNVFSPNLDNINDFVTVFSNDELARVLEFEIFDRWGEKVFRGTDFLVNEPVLGWDGRFKGQFMNPAVFVYVAKVQFRNGSIRIVSGDITLVR